MVGQAGRKLVRNVAAGKQGSGNCNETIPRLLNCVPTAVVILVDSHVAEKCRRCCELWT